jgi:hypothetical protein
MPISAGVYQFKLDQLVMDNDVRVRNDISGPHIAQLVRVLEHGETTLPPPVADIKTKIVVDGWARIHAYRRMDIDEIPVDFRKFQNKESMLAKSAELNIAHGRMLDTYDIKEVIKKLHVFGWSDKDISPIVLWPLPKVAECISQLATTIHGQAITVKAGLPAYKGRVIRRKDQHLINKWAGNEGTYHVNILIKYLGAYPKAKMTDTFVDRMDSLCQLWGKNHP